MAVTWKRLAYYEEVVPKSLFDANTILKADTDDTPAALTVGEQTLVGRITAGSIAALTASDVRTLLNVEDGADVTDATNVAAAGALMESDFVAKGDLLSATAAGTPAILSVGINGKILACNSATATGLEWVDAGTPAAHATSHKNSGSDEILLNEFGEPTGAVEFNGQQASNLVVHNVADATARGALTPVLGKMAFQIDELAIYVCTSIA